MKPLTPPTSLTNASDQLLRNESDRGFTRIFQAVNQINQSVGQFADGETPEGDVNGSNTKFKLDNAPAPVKSLKMFLDTGSGGMLVTNYTVKDKVVTFTVAPAAGTLTAYYRYQ